MAHLIHNFLTYLHESDQGPDLPRLEPKKLPVKDVVQAICNPWFVLCLKKDGSITDLKIAGYSKGKWGEELILKKSGVKNIKGTKYSNLIHNGNGTLEAYYSYMHGGSPWDIVDAVDTGNTVHPEIFHHNQYFTIKGNQLVLAKPLGRNPPKELTAYVQAQTPEGLPIGALFMVSLTE